MPINQWLIERATDRFLQGGYFDVQAPTVDGPVVDGKPTQVPDPAYAVVILPGEQMPDAAKERHDPTSLTLRRKATADELAADATTALDAKAKQDIDASKAIKAAVICALWGRLGKQPTAAEIAAERTRFIAIYKGLA